MSTIILVDSYMNNEDCVAGYIPVQSIYDWREKEEIVSGMELHAFFDAMCGDMSPSGKMYFELEDIEVLAESEPKRESYSHSPAQVAQFILADLD